MPACERPSVRLARPAQRSCESPERDSPFPKARRRDRLRNRPVPPKTLSINILRQSDELAPGFALGGRHVWLWTSSGTPQFSSGRRSAKPSSLAWSRSSWSCISVAVHGCSRPRRPCRKARSGSARSSEAPMVREVRGAGTLVPEDIQLDSGDHELAASSRSSSVRAPRSNPARSSSSSATPTSSSRRTTPSWRGRQPRRSSRTSNPR